MLRNETVGNAADLFHFRSHNATLFENLQISLGSAWQFRLEQDHYHRREENGMDSNQGRHPGIHLYHHLFFFFFIFRRLTFRLMIYKRIRPERRTLTSPMSFIWTITRPLK
jgi:hypothetical protein